MLYCVLEASFLCNVASNYHVGMSDDKHCRPWVMVILLSGRRSSNRGACVYHHTCTETLGHKYIYGYIYIPYQEYISYVLLVLCKLGRAPAVGLVYATGQECIRSFVCHLRYCSSVFVRSRKQQRRPVSYEYATS